MNRKLILVVGIVLLAVALGVSGVTAQRDPESGQLVILLPDSLENFLPLVMRSKASETAVPSGVLYVFSSTATTDGNAGGRTGMQSICSAEDSQAHLCSIYEIEHAWATTGIHFSNPFNNAWVDRPAELGTLTGVSSVWSSYCNTWTTNDGSINGLYISAMSQELLGDECDISLSVTCCKLIP